MLNFLFEKNIQYEILYLQVKVAKHQCKSPASIITFIVLAALTFFMMLHWLTICIIISYIITSDIIQYALFGNLIHSYAF